MSAVYAAAAAAVVLIPDLLAVVVAVIIEKFIPALGRMNEEAPVQPLLRFRLPQLL